MKASSNTAELDRPFSVPSQARGLYRENGYVKLESVLGAEVIAGYRAAITATLEACTSDRVPLHQRSTYDKAFLQVTNLWMKNDVVREFAFGKKLARIAAELMGCSGVRMYHDQALYKEPGGGHTPWHADQYYWPVSNDNVVTAWIPLVAVPQEMGPLAFCPGSHRFRFGRELAISDESELTLRDKLAAYGADEGPFALGDVSFHAGWTFHRAGSNQTSQTREVFTIIYMDSEMRLAAPKNKNQEADRAAFCPGCEVGEVMASPLNPLLYSER